MIFESDESKPKPMSHGSSQSPGARFDSTRVMPCFPHPPPSVPFRVVFERILLRLKLGELILHPCLLKRKVCAEKCFLLKSALNDTQQG